MTSTVSKLEGSPEERIIRGLYRTKEGGLEPGIQSREYGRVFESLLLQELQRLASQNEDRDIRFARGYVVEDYGSSKFDGASAAGASEVTTTASPRFDIVCYHGDVAWESYDGMPMALVPESLAHGVIEAKRTLSPGYLPSDSSRGMNNQFRQQREYLDGLDMDGPLVLVGAHYSGAAQEISKEAAVDHVALLGDLSNKGSASRMARDGELAKVVELL